MFLHSRLRISQCLLGNVETNAVRESANKSAASAASKDYVKFQAVIKSAASAASLAEAALAADWITAFFYNCWPR